MLLENRGDVGTDTAQMNPAFSRAKQAGLLVWQIDDGRVQQGVLPVNRVNTGVRQGVALIQADGLDQLRTPFGGNRGDTGDAFPGSAGNHDFGLMTRPSALDWDQHALDIRLDRITAAADGSVTFRYLRRAPTLIASATPVARIQANGVKAATWAEVVAPGDLLAVSADSVQVSLDGRTAARFRSWSDGGPRTHTITARAGAPDTIVARFAVANRLAIAVSGPGSVTSNAPGALGAGIFLDAGTPVQLTVTPGPGAEFIGWRGDTAAAGNLDLVMARPYDLNALFVSAVTVDPAAAARAVLGGSPLDATAAAYFDAIGNQNGSFDVGDYLAWLRRTGQRVPVALGRAGSSR
jgi:hypothetical protein